jgi:hypothetical protein
MFTVRAPNTAHNGISAGVRFTAGVGETDNPAALAYFRRAGYAVELAGLGPVEPAAIATIAVSEIAPDLLELSGMARADLVQLAKSLGLKGSGTSNDLIDRIRAARAASDAVSDSSDGIEASPPPDADPFAPGADES